MLPAINTNERADMFNVAKPGMPLQVFQSFPNLAEQVLKPYDWLAPRTRLGI